MKAGEIFILYVFIFVSLATFFIFKNKQITSLNFYLRVRSWAWMLGVLVLFSFLDDRLLSLLFLFIGIVSAREIISTWEIATVSKKKSWGNDLAALLITLTLLSVYVNLSVMLAIGVLSITVMSLYVFYANLRVEPQRKRCHFITPPSLTFILLIILIMSLSYLQQKGFTQSDLGYWFYLIFSTQFSDVCQYFFGKRFGKHQLSKTISPNKTVEGAIGGILFASMCSTFVALYITPLAWDEAIIISLLLALLGLVGDLYISWFKRQAGVKDMGTLIPGHGGMLDRIDSLLLATPILAIILVNLSAPIK